MVGQHHPPHHHFEETGIRNRHSCRWQVVFSYWCETMADRKGPPGVIYTLGEVAAHLRLTNRGIAKIAKKHGLCMIRGRDIFFTDADIQGIKDALRCPPSSSFGARFSGRVALSDIRLSTSLRALTAKRPRKRSRTGTKP